jgi:hypothetical protein
MRELRKIWRDTTQNPDGKYSRKSLQMWVSFQMACLLAILSVFRPVSVELVGAFLLASFGTAALTVWDKPKDRRDHEYDLKEGFGGKYKPINDDPN